MLVGNIKMRSLKGIINRCIPDSIVSDHEVITIDRYLLHDQVISPISENAIVSMTSNETSTNIISPVNSLSSSEIQTETYISTPVEGNFEEDIEL